jgi:feruloyl esterase
MKIIKGVLFSLLSFAVYLLVGNPAKAATCESLSLLTLPHATITAAETITSGTFTPSPPNFPITLTGLPPVCRVAITSTPTYDSLIHIEVWIPLNNWNGKFLQQGCGGLCGSIFYFNFPSGLARGYAVAATDDGNPSSVTYDGSAFLGHPDRIVDFAYRAIKETTDYAKTIIATFEGGNPKRSYFFGCSEGGREALIEAQRYPDDFDGIIVGSPANSFIHLTAGMAWDDQALLNNPASYIPPASLSVLTNAVLKQCAGQGGGLPSDPFLNDPRLCHFDPISVQCKAGQDPSTCLTPAQVQAARAIYWGPHDPVTGQLVWPGLEPGTEDQGDWQNYVSGTSYAAEISAGTGASASVGLANNFFGDIVFQNANFSYKNLNFDSDIKYADNTVGPIMSAIDPDLRPFFKHGKMIQYVGWSDGAIAAMNSVNYYNLVRDVLNDDARPGQHNGEGPDNGQGHDNGPPGQHGAASYTEIQQYDRLFTVPGMMHCGNGPGPNAFGNYFSVGDTPVVDAQHDILTALDRWVEQGTAPDQIIATHYVNNHPASGIQFQRPLCPYPQMAHWNKVGDPSKASSFTCAVNTNDNDSDPHDQNFKGYLLSSGSH